MVCLCVGLLVLMFAGSALAEDEITTCDTWDKYGCFTSDVVDDETGEKGEKYYLFFWSESSRKAIMGDSTEPYENVVGNGYYNGEEYSSSNDPDKPMTATGKKEDSGKDSYGEYLYDDYGQKEYYSFTSVAACKEIMGSSKDNWCVTHFSK